MSSSADAEQIRQDLAAVRDRRAAVAADRLARLHSRAKDARSTREIRQQAARDRAADRLTRAKDAADIRQTAEARSLRVQRTRTLSLLVLMPVLAAFGAWSTAGVHAGVTTMTAAEPGSPMWWMLWLLEPALITAVGWIILCRSWLRTSGGVLSPSAGHIMGGALGVSIVLNAIGHWPSTLDWQGIGGLIAHSLGPIGAATTAHLIGLIETAVTEAAPTEGVKSLSDLATTTTESASENASESTGEPLPALEWVRVPADSRHLPIVPRTTAQKQQSSTADQGKKQGSEAPRTTRPNKGAKVPAAARKSASEESVRALSDEELADRFSALVDDGELTVDAPVRRVQSALGIGFERAKRVIALHQDRTEITVPGQLSVVDTVDGEMAAA